MKQLISKRDVTSPRSNRKSGNPLPTFPRGGQKGVLLCAIAFGMMLFVGCTGNRKGTPLTSDQELPSDTLPQDTAQASGVAPRSIFDKLREDMVLVEGDSATFYICRYEVTQQLWTEVMGENPSQMQGEDLPVEQVSWDDCQAFIGKLNDMTGGDYRLPTEAEWEYACRGGKLSKGYDYAGSNDIDEVAWYDANSDNRTHSVGQKQPNELGLYDMSGNVWEWCQDMHEGTGMCRGGSWIHNARNCDPSLPNETPRTFSINSLGLRLAR